MQQLPAVSELKLRASYGTTGNQDIGDYNSLTQYGTNTYYLNGTRVVGISPNNIANADLSWESTAAFDGGHRSRAVQEQDQFHRRLLQ